MVRLIKNKGIVTMEDGVSLNCAFYAPLWLILPF